jgi:nucleoside-diphosphate-sugar epimerase
MSSILVTGARGQIGGELVAALHDRADSGPVVQLDRTAPASTNGPAPGPPFEVADVRDRDALARVVSKYDVGTVYHLASLLSATGEDRPDEAWSVNVDGLKNVLDLARRHDLRVFWPSSIAVFGPSTPAEKAPQQTVLDPATMYGVTKRSGELLCQYYHRRYGVDVRSLRYPGLVSHRVRPGGGTTDFAVHMFVQAAQGADYTCFLAEDTRLPFMYMPDAIRAALDLMAADESALSVRDSYNVGAFSLAPGDLETLIRRHVPTFACTYAPDARQQIADSWPASVDDRAARSDWDWAPAYDREAMTEDMLHHLRETPDPEDQEVEQS